MPDRHVEPEQHPFGQVVALQPLHVPPLQVSPPGHAMHALPTVPQAIAVSPWRHAPVDEQQPLAQVAALQATHVPLLQPSGGVHGGLLPHWQPVAAHESDVAGSQATHAAPAVPQVVGDDALQVGPEQHPFGQNAASQPLHVPPVEHVCPVRHG